MTIDFDSMRSLISLDDDSMVDGFDFIKQIKYKTSVTWLRESRSTVYFFFFLFLLDPWTDSLTSLHPSFLVCLFVCWGLCLSYLDSPIQFPPSRFGFACLFVWVWTCHIYTEKFVNLQKEKSFFWTGFSFVNAPKLATLSKRARLVDIILELWKASRKTKLSVLSVGGPYTYSSSGQRRSVYLSIYLLKTILR